MSLDKNKTVSEIGRRTRLRNHEVQRMLETLIEVWTEELVKGGRIELQNFLVLEVREVDRGENAGQLLVGGKLRRAPRRVRQVVVRVSKRLRGRLKVPGTSSP